MSVPVENAKEPSDKGCLRTRALTAVAAVGYAGFLFAAGIAPTSPITPTLSADMFTGLLGASFQTGYLAAYFVLAVLAKTTCGGLRWRYAMAGGAFLSIGYVLQGLFWAEPSLTQIGALGNTIGGIGFACLAFAWLVSMVSLGDGGSVFVLLMGSALASCVSLLFCLTGLPLSSVFAPVASLVLSLCCLGYLAWDRRRRGAPLGEVASGQDGTAPLTASGISDDKRIADDLALGATLRRVGIPMLCASLLVLVGPTVGFGAINASLLLPSSLSSRTLDCLLPSYSLSWHCESFRGASRYRGCTLSCFRCLPPCCSS